MAHRGGLRPGLRLRARLGLLDPLGGLLPRGRDRARPRGGGGGPAAAARRAPRRLPRVRPLAGGRAAPGRPRARLVDRPARAGPPPRAAPPPGPRLPRARASPARAARGRARDARRRGDAPRDHVRARLPAAAPGGGRGVRPPRRPAALPEDAGLARRRARPRGARAARERDEARLRLLPVAGGRAPLRPVREPQPLRGLHAARPADRPRAARGRLARLRAAPGRQPERAPLARRAADARGDRSRLRGAAAAPRDRGAHRLHLARRDPRLLRRPRDRGFRGPRAQGDAGVGRGARLRGGGADVVRARAAGGALPARVGRRAGPDGGVARVDPVDARLALGHGLRLQRLRRGAVAGAGVGAADGGDAVAGGGGAAARGRRAARLPRAGRPAGPRVVPRGALRLGAAAGGDGHPGAPRRPLGRPRRPAPPRGATPGSSPPWPAC